MVPSAPEPASNLVVKLGSDGSPGCGARVAPAELVTLAAASVAVEGRERRARGAFASG